jgi:hypothetical protein
MWTMVAGPCRCGEAGAAKTAENPRALNAADLAVRRLGHVPAVGFDLALPVIVAAGGDHAACEGIMMPASLALAGCCDACLRIGDRSKGAHEKAERVVAAEGPVFRGDGETPGAVRS